MKQRIQEAVGDTAGVYLVDEDGNIPKAMYKAFCGREDCPTCQGEPGTLDKHWPGQACQNGIMELASDGVPWRVLAVYYYTGWRLYDEPPAPTIPSIPDMRWQIEEAVRDGEAAMVLQDAARARLLAVIQQLYGLERG